MDEKIGKKTCIKFWVPYMRIYFFLKKAPSLISTLMKPLRLKSWCIHFSWVLRFLFFCRVTRASIDLQTGRQSPWRQAWGSPVTWLGVTEGVPRAVSTLRMDTGSGASSWGVSWFPKIEEVPGFVRLQFPSVWTSQEALRCAWEQGCLRSWGLEWGCMDDLALAYSCSFAVDF